MQIGQPFAGFVPTGTVSANRIGSMRWTTAAPSAPITISPPDDRYGGWPVWKFGALYVPVHSVYVACEAPTITFAATGAGVPNTPLRSAGPTNVACSVVNTAAETTWSRPPCASRYARSGA